MMAATTTKSSSESTDFFFVIFCVSILVGTMLVMLIYVVCSKRYKLNWFEKTMLQAATEQKFGFVGGDVTSDGALCTPKSVSSSQGSATGRFFDTPVSTPPPQQSTEFWVPPSFQRQASICQSDGLEFSGGGTASSTSDADETQCAAQESLPQTPNTPLGVGVSPFASSRQSPVQPSPTALAGVRSKRTSMHAKLDFTKIDAAMYQKSLTKTPSLPENMRGSIQFMLSYDSRAFVLHVRLIQAHDLVPRSDGGDPGGGGGSGIGPTADPYARVRLLPDTKSFRQSRVLKKTLNPTFDEDFEFDVPLNEIARRTLELLVYDFDQSARHLCMGSVQLPLEHIDLSEKVTLWKGVMPCDEKDDKAELGDLMFSLGFLPSAERLTVVILKGRNLRAVDDEKNTSDTYVKVSLLQNGRRVKKKKTATQRGTLEPVFNEAITFGVTKESLKSSTVEFGVVHDNTLGQNDQVLGRVLIGPHSKGEEARHFKDMLASKTAVARWHALTDPL